MILNNYADFCQTVCSGASKDLAEFIGRLEHLNSVSDVNLPLLLTGAVGMSSESGEFGDIVKKIFFQGKELTDENIYALKKELGDVLWYWINACTALGLDPYDVIDENINKLKARYPGGEFNVRDSESRKEE